MIRHSHPLAALALAIALLLPSGRGYAQSEPVSFAFLSDVHLCAGSPRIDNLARCIDDINGNKEVQFTIFGGDITEFGADHEIVLAKEVIDKLENPYYIVAGNHDAKWSESGCNTFAKVFGYEQFEFEKGGIKFIGCNCGPNMRMAPALLPHESLMWLDSIAGAVPREQPVIFVNHYPQDSSMLNYFQVVNTLKKCNIQLLIGGHWHSNNILDYNGVPGILGRAPDRGSSLGYNIVTIAGDSLQVRERLLRDKEGRECDVIGEPWYSMKLSSEPKYSPDQYDASVNPYGLPDDFPWIGFDVNESNPQVSEVWRSQDESDIGCGATYAGRFVAYANTQGVVKVLRSRNGKLKWSYATDGKVFSTPAVADGRLVIGSTDGYIYCFKLRNGRLLWKYQCEKSVLASPAIFEGKAFVGSSDGMFRAIDIRTGKLAWEKDGIAGFVECRPWVDAEQVVFGDWANTLYSLDTSTGELQWTWSIRGSRMLSPAAVWPVKSNGRIFIVTPARKAYAIDAKTGVQIWMSNGGRESIALSPDGSRVYVKTMSDQVQAYSTASDNAEKVWEVNPGINYDIAPTPCACEGDYIFVPTDKGNIFCLAAEDGSNVWTHKVSVALINSIVPVKNGKLLVSTMDGVVTMLKY